MEKIQIKYLIPSVKFDKPPEGNIQYNLSYRIKKENNQDEFIKSGVITFDKDGNNIDNKYLTNLKDRTDYEIKLSRENDSTTFYIRTGDTFGVGDNPYYNKKVHTNKNIYASYFSSITHESKYFDFLYPLETNKNVKYKNVNYIPDNFNTVLGNFETLVDKDDSYTERRGLVLTKKISTLKGLKIQPLFTGYWSVYRNRFGYSFYIKEDSDIRFVRFYNADSSGFIDLTYQRSTRRLVVFEKRDPSSGFILNNTFVNQNPVGSDRTVMCFPIESKKWYSIVFLGVSVSIIRHQDLKTCIMIGNYNPFNGVASSIRQYNNNLIDLIVSNNTDNNMAISEIFKLNLPQSSSSSNKDLKFIWTLCNKTYNEYTFKLKNRKNNNFIFLSSLDSYSIIGSVQYILNTTNALNDDSYTLIAEDILETSTEVCELQNDIVLQTDSVNLNFETDYENSIERFKKLFYVFSDRINKYKLENCDGGSNPNLIYGNGKNALIIESHGNNYNGDVIGKEYPEKKEPYDGIGKDITYKHGENKVGFKNNLVGSAIVFNKPLINSVIEIEFKVPEINNGVNYFFKFIDKNIIFGNQEISNDNYKSFNNARGLYRYYKERGVMIEFPVNLGVKTYDNLNHLYETFNSDFTLYQENATVTVDKSNEVENGVYKLKDVQNSNSVNGWEKICNLEDNTYKMSNIRVSSSTDEYKEYNVIHERKIPLNVNINDGEYHKLKISIGHPRSYDFNIYIDDVLVCNVNNGAVYNGYFMFGTHFRTKNSRNKDPLSEIDADFSISHLFVKSINMTFHNTNTRKLTHNSSSELGLQTIL